jgi:hypothetical protein
MLGSMLSSILFIMGCSFLAGKGMRPCFKQISNLACRRDQIQRELFPNNQRANFEFCMSGLHLFLKYSISTDLRSS